MRGEVATNVARLFCSRKCNRAACKRRALPVLGTPREVRADSLAGMWVGTPVLSHDGAELPVIDGLGAVTPAIAWVLGRWVGDGWVSRRPERGDVWSRVTICASHAEADDLAKHLAHLTDLPWNRTHQRTTDTFHVTRVGLAAFITANFGHGASGKRIPAWMLFAPEEVRQAFADGYASADGHTSRAGLRMQAATVSKELAVGMRLLLTSVGYYTTVCGVHPPPTRVIEGRTVRQRPQWMVSAYKCRERRPKHRDADGYRWGTAKGTVSPGETVTVYNLTVAEDHTYVADGVVVHNCINHSGANSVKAYKQGLTLFDLPDPDFDARVTRSEKDRATANCVLHYAEQHHPRLILVECTTELASWGPAIPGRPKIGDGSTYRWWLKQFGKLGYKHKILYLNSMFFGVPQSRDRWFGCFWDERLPAPDLEHRPPSWCGRCDKVVEAVWSWRTGIPATGRVRYGEQYNYRCPRCRTEVIPPVTPSLDALDLTNLGTRIGDRQTPLAASTMARAERCRQRFGEFPAVLMPADPATGRLLASAGVLIGAAGNTYERPGSRCRSRGLDEPLWAQTATNSTGLLTPPLAVAVDNYQGVPRGADEPLPTQVGSETIGLLTARVLPNRENGTSRGLREAMETIVGNAGGGGLGVLSTGVVPLRRESVPVTGGEPMPTVTGSQTLGLLTAAGTIKNNGSIGEAKYRAHPVSDPFGTVVGSAVTQGLLFSGWYKQNGSTAGETAAHPASDPFGTLTSRDTTALLFAEWTAAITALPLDDCYFRMMLSHEVGRGCGFNVDFPGYGHQGDFIVWGSARDQVDGFGNAVSPQVGTWIGLRLRAILDTPQATA
jgi:hypothetical protein